MRRFIVIEADAEGTTSTTWDEANLGDAIARLGYLAGQRDLALTPIPSVWVDSTIATAYKRGGDPVLHARVVLRLSQP